MHSSCSQRRPINILVNILFKVVQEDRLPDHVAALIRAIGLLMVSKMYELTASDIAALITDKLNVVAQPLVSELAQERECLKALVADHSKHTLSLVEAANTACPSLHKFGEVHGELADEFTHQILSYGLLFLTFYRFPYTAGPPTSTAPT